MLLYDRIVNCTSDEKYFGLKVIGFKKYYRIVKISHQICAYYNNVYAYSSIKYIIAHVL